MSEINSAVMCYILYVIILLFLNYSIGTPSPKSISASVQSHTVSKTTPPYWHRQSPLHSWVSRLLHVLSQPSSMARHGSWQVACRIAQHRRKGTHCVSTCRGALALYMNYVKLVLPHGWEGCNGYLPLCDNSFCF